MQQLNFIIQRHENLKIKIAIDLLKISNELNLYLLFLQLI